ncbi:MAG: hypothetical protein VW127_00195 [Flavobacteriaceae bacterium]
MLAVRSNGSLRWDDISDQIEFPDGTRYESVFRVRRDKLQNLLKS